MVGAKLLRDSLVADTIAKIKILETENEGETVSVFNEQLTAITAFTDDIRVVRLHLLAHYARKKDCVKIAFLTSNLQAENSIIYIYTQFSHSMFSATIIGKEEI